MLVSRYGTRLAMRAEIPNQTPAPLTAVRPVGDAPAVRPVDPGAAPPAARSRARPYVLAMVIAGCLVLAHPLAQFLGQPANLEWWVLALLTLLSGSAVLKMPSVAVNFS